MISPPDVHDPLPTDDSVGTRILRVARDHFFRFGYGGSTMDDLAGELGMSKKTLYQHFPGKEAIIDAIVGFMGQRIANRLAAITSNPKLSFVEKLVAAVDTIGGVLSRVSPAMLRDLQRYAPATYEKIEQVRQRNIPLYFSRIIQDGIAQGMIRPGIEPSFAGQFWLQAIRGLIQPDVLEKTQLSPKQTLEKAIDLFFGGLLTPMGRQDYENHFAPGQKPGASA